MEPIRSSSQGFSGTVNLQLTDLIQMICLSRSDLAVCVKSGRGSGTIYVKEGEIHHAETQTLQGESAFFEILRWKDGQFEILPFKDLGISTVHKSWEYLLLEAMRQRDEEAAGEVLPEDLGDYQEALLESSADAEMVGNIDLTFDDLDASVEQAALASETEEAGPAAEPREEEDTRQEPFASLQDDRIVKVLVVDDSPFFARQLKRMMEAHPNTQVVTNARNGKEAVDFLASNPAPDLITLDVEMPVMQGDATLKHIMVRFPIPVVMISGFQTQSLDKIFEFLQLGAVDFFKKPDAQEDITLYAENLLRLVRRAARADVSHFRRLRKVRGTSRAKAGSGPESDRILVIVGAEGAYMDWFRLPIQDLCRNGLVIGLQKLSDPFLPGFCRLIQDKTRSTTETLMHSEWVNPGGFYLGNASQRVRLKLIKESLSLGIEMFSSESLQWYEGIHFWLSQLADQAGSQVSIYFLSAAHSLSRGFIEKLLGAKVQLIVPPLDTVMCTDLVESILPYLQHHQKQIVWGSPENLMEVWLGYEPDA